MTTQSTGAPEHRASLRKPILRLALFLVLVVFVLTTETCHNHLFLFPRTTITRTPADYNLPYEDVSFPSANGNKLAGWYCPAENEIGALVLNHGNTGNIDGYIDYARILTERGVSVLLYDYQGFGASEGKASISSLIDDGVAAFDYLVSRGHAPGKTAVMGVSLGTMVSCGVIPRRPKAACMILEGAFVPETELYWRMGTLGAPIAFIISRSLPAIDPKKNVAALNGRPLLMVHGADDATTPLYGAGELFQAARQPKWMWVIDGVKHFPEPIFYRREQYQEVLVSFLRSAFLGEPFDQPRVSWSFTGTGPWKVSASLAQGAPSAELVIITEGNSAIRRKSTRGMVVSVNDRPVTVAAFAEPHAVEPEGQDGEKREADD